MDTPFSCDRFDPYLCTAVASAGAIVLLTCIVILAVDFPVFPRDFAKTETFGVSLMDLGTGAFIFSSALTSRLVRGLPPQTIYSVLFSWKRLVVFLLAVGRTVAIKALRYQEHVSEYGESFCPIDILFASNGYNPPPYLPCHPTDGLPFRS